MAGIKHSVRGVKLIIGGDTPNIKLDKFCRKLAGGFFDNTPSQLYMFFEGKLVNFKPNWCRQQYLLRYLFYSMKHNCRLCVFQHSDELRIWKRIAESMLINGSKINSQNLRTSDDEPSQEDKVLIKELLDTLDATRPVVSPYR